MDNIQKKILIDGVKFAGQTIQGHLGKIDKVSMTKVASFDYGIPADKMSEKIIFEAIQETKLDCRIISEESDVIGSLEAEYTIYVDPLDGSVNFSRGIPACCIGIAVYRGKDPLFAVIYDFNVDEIFVAEVGNGITCNGENIFLQFFQENILINLEWFGANRYENIVQGLKQNNIRARTSGSGVLALCYGCIGRGDGAILIENKPWDIAPGMVFAKVLGYESRQFNGEEVDLSILKQSIVVAPKVLFDDLIKVVSP